MIIVRILFLFAFFLGKEKGVQYKVSVSFLEVYNENIRDLLNDSEEYLDLREDPIKGEERNLSKHVNKKKIKIKIKKCKFKLD